MTGRRSTTAGLVLLTIMIVAAWRLTAAGGADAGRTGAGAAGPATRPAGGGGGTEKTDKTEKVVKGDDGITRRYRVDAQGRRNGPYEELFPNGKARARGTYLSGAKTGTWTTWNEAAKTVESMSYLNGVPEGPYTWTSPTSKAGVRGTYHDGGFSGPVAVQDADGRVTRQANYPRSLGEIRKNWADLYPKADKPATFTQEPHVTAPYKAGAIAAADLEEGMKLLKLYRYLSGVPWQGLTLDPAANLKSQHGAVLMRQLGYWTHDPPKPADMDDAFFKLAFAGCHEGCVFHTTGPGYLRAAVRFWMDDSDEQNIRQIAHRRWSLKPGLKRIGLGWADGFAAMHVLDGSTDPANYTFVGFPGEGYCPLQLVETHYAWSAHFSLGRLQVPEGTEPKVRVLRLDEHFQPVGEVKTEWVNVIREPAKGWTVIVFKPEIVPGSNGAPGHGQLVPPGRYGVEISGLATPQKAAARFSYVVDLIDINAAPPADEPHVELAGAAGAAPAATRPAAAGAPVAAANLALKVETDADGTVHRFHVDPQGRRSGPYEELFSGGKVHFRGSYAAGERAGTWTEYDESGKVVESVTFANGVLDGPYAWNAPAGKAAVRGAYRQGGFAGTVTVTAADGRPAVRVEYARTVSDIEKVWAQLYPREIERETPTASRRLIEPARFVTEPNLVPPYRAGEVTSESLQEGLKTVKLYRYLAGLPWQHLTIDPAACRKAQHAAVLLQRLKRLDYAPQKDFPELAEMDAAFFQLASAGCSESNLSGGDDQIPGAVRCSMDDSDGTNAGSIGRRIRMLKPQLKRLGFGYANGYCAVHVQDGSSDPIDPGLKFFAFPGEGYYPRVLVESHYAWSAHFGPSFGQLPQGMPRVKVTRLDDNFQPKEDVPAEVTGVVRSPPNMEGWSVVMFRPKLKSGPNGISLTRTHRAVPAGKYLVEISGLLAADRSPTGFSYVVDLVDISGTLPAIVPKTPAMPAKPKPAQPARPTASTPGPAMK